MKKPTQEQINKNLAETLDLPTENETNISDKPKKTRGPYKNKAPTRGGARKNAGRPKGSSNKISPQELLEEFEGQTGTTFAQFITKKIIEADMVNNQDLVAKYLLGLSKYIIQDIQEVKQDITSNGQTIQASFTFANKELPDWSSAKIKLQ